MNATVNQFNSVLTAVLMLTLTVLLASSVQRTIQDFLNLEMT